MRNSTKVLAVIAAMGLIVPVCTMAAEGDPDPSFTNPAQAQHAENLAENSVEEGDVETTAVENYANDTAPGLAKIEIEEKVVAHAESVVEAGAEEAASVAYAVAVATVVNPDPQSNAYKTAYQAAYDDAIALGYDDFANVPDYQNTYDDWLTVNEVAVYDAAYASALARAEGVGWEGPNALESATARITAELIAAGEIPAELYDVYYAEALISVTGVQRDLIHFMRYDQDKGWGLIAKELGVHPKVLGLGHMKKIGQPAEVPAPAIDPLEAEILDATRRTVQTGWEKGKGNKSRNNEKKAYSSVGLAAANNVDDSSDAATTSSARGKSGKDSSEKSNNGKSATGSSASNNSNANSNSNSNASSNSNSNSNSNASSNSNSNSNSNASSNSNSNSNSNASSNSNSNSNSNASSNANSNSNSNANNNSSSNASSKSNSGNSNSNSNADKSKSNNGKAVGKN